MNTAAITAFFQTKTARYIAIALAVAIALFVALKFWFITLLVALVVIAYLERANLAALVSKVTGTAPPAA